MVYDTQITNYSIPGVNLNQDSHHGGAHIVPAPWILPSGNVKIVIENDHTNSEFSYEQFGDFQ